MTNDELVKALEGVRNMMIAVATGGPRIDSIDPDYQNLFAEVSNELAHRGIGNPIPYGTLWDWYGRWSSGDLPSYRSRRSFVAELVNPVIRRVRTGRTEEPLETGWSRVDRTIGEVRERLGPAENEEQFQAVGLLCREALISLAQAVYVRECHPSLDATVPSPTDAKRMLEAYISVELAGSANEEVRKHARSALDVANALQHRRTATFRDAAICVEATTAVVNLVAIIAGQRDPQ